MTINHMTRVLWILSIGVGEGGRGGRERVTERGGGRERKRAM